MKAAIQILSFIVLSAGVAQATTVAEANTIVQNLVANTVTSSVATFCGLQPDWQCRTINYLKDKTTGQPVNAFWTTFDAPGRRAGGVHYFVAVNQNQNGLAGEYQVFSYPYLDTSVAIDEVYTNTMVTGNYEALTEITNDTLKVLGTTNYVRNVDIKVGNNTMSLNGVVYETLTSQKQIGTYSKQLSYRSN